MDEIKRLQQLAGINEIKVNNPIGPQNMSQLFSLAEEKDREDGLWDIIGDLWDYYSEDMAGDMSQQEVIDILDNGNPLNTKIAKSIISEFIDPNTEYNY